jgi:hypothetical protein
MGWGSFFKTVGKIGAGVAAPFTGGASLAAIPMIDGVSKGLGAGSQAAASNRGTKAEMMMDQNSDLERQLLAREAEKRSAQQGAYRAAMTGAHGTSWKPLARPAGIPGSYREMDPTSLDAAKMLNQQGRMRLGADDLNSRDSMSGMPAYRDLSKDKQFQKTLDPGFWEKLAGVGSAVAPIVGGIFGKNRPVQN